MSKRHQDDRERGLCVIEAIRRRSSGIAAPEASRIGTWPIAFIVPDKPIVSLDPLDSVEFKLRGEIARKLNEAEMRSIGER